MILLIVMSAEKHAEEDQKKQNKRLKVKTEEDRKLESVEVESTGGGIGAGGG
jgi:hypothetical protein